MQDQKVGSATREYVVCCSRLASDGRKSVYFRSFKLPEVDDWFGGGIGPLENSTSTASWYFLNRLNFAFVEFVVCREDFDGDVKDQVEVNEQIRAEAERFAAEIKAEEANPEGPRKNA